MDAPVGVIIPCYCCAETIERAVSSVVHQTLKPREILLVEDKSPDGGKTISVLRRLKRKYDKEINLKIFCLSQNWGPSEARNFGWDNATQPFLAFLDADDAWHPKKLEIQYSWMQNHPSIEITGHDTVFMRAGSETPNLPDTWRARRVTSGVMLFSNRLPTRTVMLRQELPFRFEPEKLYSEDYYLWLQVILKGYSVWRIGLPLAFSFKEDFGAAGMTGDLWKMERGELETYFRLYTERHLSFFQTGAAMIFSLLKYFRRALVTRIREV